MVREEEEEKESQNKGSGLQNIQLWEEAHSPFGDITCTYLQGNIYIY